MAFKPRTRLKSLVTTVQALNHQNDNEDGMDYEGMCLVKISRSHDGKGAFYAVTFGFYDGENIGRNQHSALIRPFRTTIRDGKPVNEWYL